MGSAMLLFRVRAITMLLILCIQNIFAQDVQYHITQVGINTVLKNLRHAKIYEDALTEGLRYNVTETLYYHHNWHILEVRFDASSPQYRLTRTAKVLGLHVEFGNKTIDPNSIGTITMTGNLRVSQKVEAFVECATVYITSAPFTAHADILQISEGQYDYRISVTSTPTVDWDSCYQSKFDHWLVNFLAGELNDKAMDLMNQVLRDQLSNIVIPGIINVTDNLYLSYKVKHLSIQPGSAFSAQANVSFHTRIPAQTFGLHRKNLIPQYWPVAPKVKSTMMGIGISKTTFTNFLDALSVAGMLDFSGKTILFGTHLFFNGSIDKPSVQFPKGAVHTSAIVHQKSLRVRLDCNNSFNIFRAELNNVTEHLVLGCKSWEDGLFVQLKNMTIASAVVAAESSTLPLPNSVLKPLAQRGLDSAVPYVDKILSKIKIHFPVETKWLTPTGPHPITRTIGEENGEDGYMQIMWICTCSEDTYYEHCGDDFCASSGSTKDDLTAFTKKKRTVQKTTTIGKLNEFLPVYPITLQDNITNRSAKNSSCYTLAYFSNNDCDMEKVGEVVNKVILCSPKTSTSVCLEPPNLLQSYFGEEISGSSFSTIPKFGIKCMSGCKTCLSMFSELNKCTSSFVLSHSDITGKFICDEDNTVVPVVGISWVWVVGIYILGAALPLFAILYSPPAFAERHGNDYVDYEEKDCSKDSCLCLSWAIIIVVPIILCHCIFENRPMASEWKNPGKWEFFAIVFVFIAFLLYAVVLVGMSCRPSTSGSCLSNSIYNYGIVTNFLAILTISGLLSYLFFSLCGDKTVSIGWKYFASFLWFLMFLLPIVVFYVYFTKRKAEFRNRPKSDCMSVPSPPMYLAWGTGWFLFGVCYIISRGFADLESGQYKNFVTGMKEKDLEVLRDHFKSAYTVLKLAILNLFGPKDIGNTLAEFFGADVILGDIVFGLVNLARVDKTTFGLS